MRTSDHKTRRLFTVELWSINRILRWTGFRIGVGYTGSHFLDPEGRTTISLVWYGWR